LVGAAKLQQAAVLVVQLQEVVGLEDLVQKLVQVHAGAGQPALYRLLFQQMLHAEKAAVGVQEINHVHILVPLHIVDYSDWFQRISIS